MFDIKRPINFYVLLCTFSLPIVVGWSPKIGRSQPILPAPDGTNTQVTQQGNQFNINRGQLSRDGANLFHSFEKFGLTEGQIANFISNPNIQNILGRVTGGDPSIINGLIQVTGGNSNLFLLNPTGIIFGPNARLNIPGSFLPTTATGVGFDNGTLFNAVGENNWSELVGTPDTLRFEGVNRQNFPQLENLTIADGQTVTIAAPQADISLERIPGQNLIRISQSGNILSLEIPVPDSSFTLNSPISFGISLPDLLTGSRGSNANALDVNRNGELVLTGSGMTTLANIEVNGEQATSQTEHNIDISGTIMLEEPRVTLNINPPENTREFIAVNTDRNLAVDVTGNDNFNFSPRLSYLSEVRQSVDLETLFTDRPADNTISGLPFYTIDSSVSHELNEHDLFNVHQLEVGKGHDLNRVNSMDFYSSMGRENTTAEMSGDGYSMTFSGEAFPESTRYDFQSNTFSIVAQSTINNPLNLSQIESGILQIENRWSQQFSDYFQEEVPYIKSATNIREMLGTIENETGQRPAIVYAIAEPERLTLMAIAAGHSFVKSIPVSRKELLRRAREFRAFVSNPRNNIYKKTAKELYGWLIEPLEKDLQARGINTLIFSLDAGLRAIPIAALFDGETFLVEKYNLSLIPSVSLTDASYKGLENAQLLAMGASEFSEKDPLPAVPVELSTITSIWGKNETFFLNKDFTLSNLKAQRHQHQIVHLATHADFRSEEDSYIQLADSKLKIEQLRELKWYESPTVELLVLSACRTGIGDEEMEMGFAGLSVQAGVKSALASLWFVSDEGTLALMTQFYQQLRKRPIKATALQQAQIAMLRGEVRFESGRLSAMRSPNKVRLPPELANLSDRNIDLSHPFYWAGFTLIGSPW